MGLFSQLAQSPQPLSPQPPQMQGGGMPPGGMPQGSQPPAPPMQPPTAGAGGIPPQILQMLLAQIMKQAPQQMAQQGRNGDTMVAHLTPGEIMVPPQVQTHKVLATLNKAYKAKHVSPSQFTAGSPQSSHNPATGMPEYNFLSAFLPAALGIAGAVAAPELLPALGMSGLGTTAAGAIGSGLGTTVGGLASGQKPTQAALSGIGAGAGGYALGNLGSGLSAMGNVPAGASALPGPTQLSAGLGGLPGAPNAAQFTAQHAMTPSLNNLYGALPKGMSVMGGLGSTIGGAVGSSMGAPPVSNSPNYPPGFNDPMPPVGSLGSAQQQLGMTNSKQPRPTFTGFNPATNYPASYNFYPGSQ